MDVVHAVAELFTGYVSTPIVGSRVKVGSEAAANAIDSISI